MTTHYLAVTIDTDPDGLNTNTPDRRNLIWDGLHFALANFHSALPDYPLTWYVRADGQLEYAYGSATYLLDEYSDFWEIAITRGDELGWHPHLYTVPQDEAQPEIITDSAIAVHELARIWELIKDRSYDFKSFRMGEGWHSAETLNLIEKLGFTIDSTAIPDRDDSTSGHPRNWRDTPNQPYYPDKNVPRLAGAKRHLLEIPMNSWYFQATYDKAPKLRYMNPCIHSDLWQQALVIWKDILLSENNFVWVMILHPAEAMPHETSDMLYAYSLEAVQANLNSMEATLHDLGHDVEWVTISQAASVWKNA